LDGGGVRGLLTAQLLTNIEEYLNRKTGKVLPLGRRFDLLVGTSTGGLIALALAAGKPASAVLAFYEEYIPRIFGKHYSRWLWLARPKYRAGKLRAALQAFFGDLTLQDLVVDACVVGVSLQNAKPRLYKTGYLKRNTGRLGEKIVDVALGTSAAPTYFPSHSAKFSSDVIDGGLCANNPAVVGIVEALQFEEPSKRSGACSVPPKREDLKMISVGTGEPCAMTYDHRKLRSAGLRRWILSFGQSGLSVPLFEVTTESQSVLAHFQAMFMLQANYLRINPRLTFPMRLDDVSRIGELRNLGDLDKVTEVFLTEHF
jgi:patatin-like phospholipase/acyl hydrolase